MPVLLDHVTKKKVISTTTIPMATILGKVEIYHGELALIKLFAPKITWFCKFNRYSIYILYFIK